MKPVRPSLLRRLLGLGEKARPGARPANRARLSVEVLEVRQLLSSGPVLVALQSPIENDNITDTTPTLQWSAASGATSYRVYVVDLHANAVVVDVTVFDISHTISSPLPYEHTYRWWVQPLGSGAFGDWSDGRNFSVDHFVPNELTFCIGPMGFVDDPTPTFRWAALGNNYRVFVVENDTGNIPLDVSGLTGTSFTAPTPLAKGTAYHWFVQAFNGGTLLQTSHGYDFTIQSPKPGRSTLHSPIGTADTKKPTLDWSARDASSFKVRLKDLTTGQIVVDKRVQGITQLTPKNLVDGHKYRWWVRSVGAAWSAPRTFRVAVPKPGTVLLDGPSGAIDDRKPTFQWQAAEHAERYRLRVTDVTTGTVLIDRWVRDTEFTSTTALPNGHRYRWQVRAWNEGKFGDWSAGLGFRILAA
jgi:hypothetical protein